MTITEIKTKLGVEQLNLNKQVDMKTKQPTGWLKMWENDKRRAIVIHQDVVAKIQAGDANLDLKEPVTKTGEQGDYTLVTIFAYNSTDVVL